MTGFTRIEESCHEIGITDQARIMALFESLRDFEPIEDHDALVVRLRELDAQRPRPQEHRSSEPGDNLDERFAEAALSDGIRIPAETPKRSDAEQSELDAFAAQVREGTLQARRGGSYD